MIAQFADVSMRACVRLIHCALAMRGLNGGREVADVKEIEELEDLSKREGCDGEMELKLGWYAELVESDCVVGRVVSGLNEGESGYGARHWADSLVRSCLELGRYDTYRNFMARMMRSLIFCGVTMFKPALTRRTIETE